jgi:hypothetical protein
MTSKMESLKEKLARLQREIEAEEIREKQEAAAARIRDTFTEAIRETVARVEQETGESLKAIGLGIWVAYPVDSAQESVLNVSALAVGLDGFPKGATSKKPTSTGTRANGNGNGNGNGDYEYVLGDGRVFDTCEKAVNALGEVTRDSEGNLLDGKKYWTRHDRLPKELADAITKRAKASTPETPATSDPAAPETSDPAPAGASNNEGEATSDPAAPETSTPVPAAGSRRNRN